MLFGIVWSKTAFSFFFFLFLSLQFIVTVSWVGNVPSLTLKGISRSLRRRGKWVREILESSILPADSGIPNTPALTKQCTGMYLTCFRRLSDATRYAIAPDEEETPSCIPK